MAAAAAAAHDDSANGSGYKLVNDDYTTPLGRDDRWPNQRRVRYTPGTDVWIEDAVLYGDSLKRSSLCTSLALHYCQYALETLPFAQYANVFNIDSLRLLRVTPLRWPSANPSTTPLFVEEPGTITLVRKRGAVGLHVDGEVTDREERNALLSGLLMETSTFCNLGRITYYDEGRLIWSIDGNDRSWQGEASRCQTTARPDFAWRTLMQRREERQRAAAEAEAAAIVRRRRQYGLSTLAMLIAMVVVARSGGGGVK